MCGIFAYIGKDDAIKSCINGIKQLEYRGYDSAGIAGIIDGKIHFCKQIGNISSLEKKIKLKDLKLDFAIAHTRWATHGIPNEINAHPHFDDDESLALVHNGIIENHLEIKQELMAKGKTFITDTDTEVIAQLISFNYNLVEDLEKSLQKSMKMIKGSFAIAMIHESFPNTIFAASRESPLAIGYSDNKNDFLISSDPNAFLGYNLNILFLENDEIAIINTKEGKASLNIFDLNLLPIEKKIEKLEGVGKKTTKGDFEHYMLKEIVEQPITIQKAFLGRINEEKATCDFKNLQIDEKELKNIDKIIIIGCGTSYHAGLIGADLFEDLVKIPTTCEIASELRYKNSIITKNTLAITISQSGETADTIAAMRELKKLDVKTICICNKNNTTLTRDSDSTLFLNAGPEISVCSTKAFTSQITVLFLFSIFLARLKGMDFAKAKYLLNELKEIPKKVKQIIDQKDVLKNFAKKYSHFDNFFFIGRKFMYPTAMEAALKLKEISYINASAYPAGELKHGPLALLSKNFPVLALTSNEHTFEKILSNMMEVKARNAPMIAFTCEGSKNVDKIADDVFYLPKTIDELSTLLSSVAGQLFAYYVANERGETIDQPRNLAKSVTVE